jgi:hypothetical protein
MKEGITRFNYIVPIYQLVVTSPFGEPVAYWFARWTFQKSPGCTVKCGRMILVEVLGRSSNLLKVDLKRDKMECYGLDLAQDRGQWRHLVNTVMNLQVQ